MWGADREQHAPGSLYLCQPSAHIPPWQTGLKSRWRDTGRERYVRCVGVDEKDQTQNRRTALVFSFCFFTSRDLITAARESQPARPLRSGWGKCSQAVRAAFGGSVVSESGSRAKKVKGGASGRQEKVKKWDMVGGEGWWESPFLSSSLAESLNWYLFVCHHAWLHAHTNTHTHTHKTGTHSTDQSTRTLQVLVSYSVGEFQGMKGSRLNILWHPSVFRLLSRSHPEGLSHRSPRGPFTLLQETWNFNTGKRVKISLTEL